MDIEIEKDLYEEFNADQTADQGFWNESENFDMQWSEQQNLSLSSANQVNAWRNDVMRSIPNPIDSTGLINAYSAENYEGFGINDFLYDEQGTPLEIMAKLAMDDNH